MKNRKLMGAVFVLLTAGIAMYAMDQGGVEAQVVKEGIDIFAGEYEESVSYWGNFRSDGYVTVRLQTRSDYPLVYFTFKDLPATIRIGGAMYNITYYDNTKITLKKLE